MKQVYSVSGLTCPNCSAKIEREIAALDNVHIATVNLMNQTLTVETTLAQPHVIDEEIQRIVHSHEPNVVVTAISHTRSAAFSSSRMEKSEMVMIFRMVIGAILYGIGIVLTLCLDISESLQIAVLIPAYLILGYDVVWRAVKSILRGRVFDEHFLMSVSTIGAWLIAEYPEAVAVMLFYQLGEFFQSLAVKRSRRSIAALMDIRPDHAQVLKNDEWVTVSPEDVTAGDVLLVKAGEKIPLDGIVSDGDSMLDTVALTGESIPQSVSKGSQVLSGCINLQGALTIRVTKAYHESTVSKVLELVENASSRKAPTEQFITTFAKYYTPVVVLLAALLSILPPLILHDDFMTWIHRGLVFLVISCPCALVISIPLTFFGGIGAASKRGILIKGSNYLEALNHVKTVVFDKTGTLTKGVFRVTTICPASSFSKEDVLEYAAKAECLSTHPIARSILDAYGNPIDRHIISQYTELAGHGVCVAVDCHHVLAGNRTLMEQNFIPIPHHDDIGTTIYVAIDEQFAGYIIIADEVKDDSAQTIQKLKGRGIEKLYMLTGDEHAIGKAVAESLGLDGFYTRLLPKDKVNILEQLDAQKPLGTKLAFVGDGINDAPVLARADVGIAMGALGSDAAIEAADVVLMTDEPSKLTEALDIAKATRRIITENIVFALSIKCIFLILGACGIAGMWEAVFSDVGVTLLAVLNAMRLLKL